VIVEGDLPFPSDIAAGATRASTGGEYSESAIIATDTAEMACKFDALIVAQGNHLAQRVERFREAPFGAKRNSEQ
jgi:hypothetical protein